MANYTLNILFEPKDIEAVYKSNLKVVLVQNDNKIAWLSFIPFQENYVTWSDDYYVYASHNKLAAGSKIHISADSNATLNNLYAFSEGAFECDSSNPPTDGSFAIVNKMHDYNSLTFGLAQNVECNGDISKNPISALSLPIDYTAVFKIPPSNTITVFLSTTINSSEIFDSTSSKFSVVTFGNNNTELTIKYDSSIGGFMQI
jgi:hypothetical protein